MDADGWVEMTDLSQYEVETTELTDKELLKGILGLNQLYRDVKGQSDSSKKERRQIDDVLEEYLEEDQWRREK